MTDMTRNPHQSPTTRGAAWGPERAALGLSLRQLEKLSGINRGILSLVEAGRIVPSGREYAAVTEALRRYRETAAV
jgi:hypothetical protein